MTNKITNTDGKIFYKAKGTVKNFNEETGYGFIFTIDQPDKDIYVHISQLQVLTNDEKDKVLKAGDEVEFLYTDYQDKGFRAYQVKKI